MPNNYFQFKQFTIHQAECAMKVTTEACLFGALAAQYLADYPAAYLLDIGCGTGLLAAMLAQQQSHSRMDAVEIELGAYHQACQNVAGLSWPHHIQVHHTDIAHFTSAIRYDFIISNPPFYEHNLKGHSHHRNLAHHDAGLTLSLLMQQADRLLAPDGCFCMLLPYQRSANAVQLAAQYGLYCMRQVMLRQTERHPFFRTVMFFARHRQPCQFTEVTIRQQGDYSEAFKNLLQPYYLHL